VRVEGREVVHPLAEPDHLHGHPELALHVHDDAALGGAVELGEHDAGDVHGLGEHPGLLHAVLPGGRVDHEQHLGDLVAVQALLGDPAHLAELVHQALLVLEAAGGVDDDDVDLLLDAGAHGVEGDRGGIGAVAVRADGVDPHPRAPGRELIGGGGAEGVRRAEHDGAVRGHEHAGELADGGGLAGAVDPDHEQHGGDLGAVGGGATGRGQAPVQARVDECDELLAQHLAHGGDVVGAEHLDATPEVLEHLVGRGRAEVGHQQRLLDLVPGVLVHGGAGEEGEDAAAEGAGAGEPLAQAQHPALGRLGRLDDGSGGSGRSGGVVDRGRLGGSRLSGRGLGGRGAGGRRLSGRGLGGSGRDGGAAVRTGGALLDLARDVGRLLVEGDVLDGLGLRRAGGGAVGALDRRLRRTVGGLGGRGGESIGPGGGRGPLLDRGRGPGGRAGAVVRAARLVGRVLRRGGAAAAAEEGPGTDAEHDDTSTASGDEGE
jgi:hypothetical protein